MLGVGGADGTAAPLGGSEEAELLRAVADQQVLGLLVVVEHHLVVLAADARLLVAAERRVRGIGVVAVGPDPARLDAAAEAVGAVHVAGPDAGAEAVERVVGDRQRLGVVLEGRDREDRPEDLLLEDPHLVMALEHRRLDVEALAEVARQVVASAAGEQLGAFLAADVDVAQDLLQLLARGLRADHRRRIERVALDDRLGPGDRPLHEAVIDRLVDQRAARAGADLALVEGEHHEALDRLVEVIVVLGHDVLEEDVRGLAAELQRDRDQVLAGVLHDQPAGGRLAGEGDLGDARARRERLAGLQPEAVDDVEHAGGQQVADQVGEHQDRGRGLLGGLQHHAVAGGQRRGELPDRHQHREVPGDDLPDHAEGFVEVVGDGVVVDLGEAALLGADRAGEVAEVVDGQRHVGGGGLADRLAVVPGLGPGQQVDVRLHPVGDAVQDQRALGDAGPAPGVLRRVGGVEGGLDVGRVGAGDLAQLRAVYRREVVEIPARRPARPTCRR